MYWVIDTVFLNIISKWLYPKCIGSDDVRDCIVWEVSAIFVYYFDMIVLF